MKEKISELRKEILCKQDELVDLWIDYVREQKEIPLGGFNVSLYEGFCEPMERMFYRDGDIIFVDAFGNEEGFADACTMETFKDLEFIVFGD